MISKYLGLDLGGTNIKISIIEGENSKWSILFQDQVKTEADKGPDHVVELLSKLAKKYSEGVSGIGVAVPGIFDSDLGTIQLFSNLPGPWKDHEMLKPIAEATGKPTKLINDARAFALAESVIGAAAGRQTVACVVLGTGVGGGIIIDGKVWMGATNGAGEIAHQIVNPEGPICGCGTKGCLEALISSKAICEKAGTSSPEEAYKKAISGDEKANEAFKDVARWLAIGMRNVLALLSPDIYIVGGGVAQAGDLLINLIKNEFDLLNHLWPNQNFPIVASKIGPYAGSIGAALFGAQISF